MPVPLLFFRDNFALRKRKKNLNVRYTASVTYIRCVNGHEELIHPWHGAVPLRRFQRQRLEQCCTNLTSASSPALRDLA